MRKRNRIISAFFLLLFVVVLYVGAAVSTEKNEIQESGEKKTELLVAVLDTGYAGESNRIAGEAANTIDGNADISDGNGHGTDMINIILDYTPEEVKVLPIKIADYKGYSTEEAAYQGIRYAMENHADIIHMSLNMSNLDKDSKLVAVLEEAIDSGIDVVVSAGNSAKDVKDVFPANISGAIVVSATDSEGDFWEYSNFGKTIDFVADGSYLGKQGTSYAAAKVTAMLADEYLSGGNLDTLKEKAVDAGEKGKDDYYGYGILSLSKVVSEEIQEETYIGKSEYDIGPRILELDWENTDTELLEKYFIETHRAYVGMYLSGFDKEELGQLKEKVPVLNTEVLVQDFELDKAGSSYKEAASHSEGFIANALKTYQSYEEELSISAEFLMLKNDGYFAVSSHNRNDIYYFQVSGFSYTVANTESEWFEMFNPQKLTVTRTIVKQTTGFGAVYVAGLSTFASGVSNFAVQYTNANTGAVTFSDNLFSIDAEADNGIVSYGLAVTLGGYSNYKEGYHTTETDIIQIPYNYTHTYFQYSYAAYPEPLQYVFSYYIPETNGVGYSDVPQRVEVQPKNFKKLTPVTMKIWYDGVYKDGYDYRNVNESLSFSDKLNTYLSSWREKTVYGVNMYSTETSLTDTSLTINFNLGNSMAIQWNNGETATVATRSDIPEYNFPLVINTYTVKYNGNGATGGSMSNMAMTYGAAKNLSANQFSRTGYKFKGWSTSANGGVVYADKQSVNNLTTQHNVTVNLYAVWEPVTYTVKYHGNGATGGSMSDSTTTYDKSQNLAANGFSKTGYSFSGWSTSANGGVVYTNKQSVKNLTSTSGGTINLYAVWGPISYTVKYHGNGATGGSMSDTVMTYDTAANLAANKFIKTGYLFQGWSTSAGGSVVYTDKQSVKNLTATSGGTVNLYAVWKTITYTLKFSGNGATGGSMPDMSMTYDTAVNLTTNQFSKTGYTFKNWNTKADGSGTAYADGASVKNLTAQNGATVTLYA